MNLINDRFTKILPEDPRTLQETPEIVNIMNFADDDAQYWHFGLENCLRRVFRDIKEPKTISVNININMDGLPANCLIVQRLNLADFVQHHRNAGCASNAYWHIFRVRQNR